MVGWLVRASSHCLNDCKFVNSHVTSRDSILSDTLPNNARPRWVNCDALQCTMECHNVTTSVYRYACLRTCMQWMDAQCMHACIYVCTILDEFVSELAKNLQSASELFGFIVSFVGKTFLQFENFVSLINSCSSIFATSPKLESAIAFSRG